MQVMKQIYWVFLPSKIFFIFYLYLWNKNIYFSKQIQVIERIYEDFEYLEHCVTTDQSTEGIIVPPLPPKPATDVPLTDINTKKLLAKGEK